MRKGIFIAALFGIFCSHSSYAENKQKTATSHKKVLVCFFSRTGENYAVGNIKKGNTHFIAEMIAEETGGQLFEIKTKKEYPAVYRACTEVAKEEKESSARPEIQSDIAIEDYDVIFIGYPNWWGDMPMAIYTFIEKHNWQGKTVVPFCTHEGSGLSDTENYVKKVCKGSMVLKGIAVKGTVAQNEQAKAKMAIQSWIRDLRY